MVKVSLTDIGGEICLYTIASLFFEAGNLAIIRDPSIPGPAGNTPARMYDARENRQPGPVMVFFHGGGFVIGDIDTHEPYCAEVARQLDMPVISVDYRLAPEHPFPAAPEDCEAAARWIADNIPCKGLVLSGDSAGGKVTPPPPRTPKRSARALGNPNPT